MERSYQHVDPTAVGNAGRLVVSELGGRANTAIRAEQLGHELEGVARSARAVQLIKQLEADGLAFEGAEASFELLIRRHSAGLRRAVPDRRLHGASWSSATAGSCSPRRPSRSRSTGRCCTPPRDGNGPVNALDGALRKALRAFYPVLDEVHLVDYKVRILDGVAATAAAHPRDHRLAWTASRTWSTMGSDTNIIAASAAALADSLEYAIWKSGAELRRRDERHFTTTNGTGAAAAAPGDPA